MKHAFIFFLTLIFYNIITAQTNNLQNVYNEVRRTANSLKNQRAPQPQIPPTVQQAQKDISGRMAKAQNIFSDARYFLMNGNQIVGNIYDYGGIAPGDGLIRNVNNMVWRGLGDIYQFGPFVGAAVNVAEKISALAKSNDGKIFVASDNGVAYSSNGGANWIEVDSGLSDKRTNALGITSDNTVFVATGGSGIFKKLPAKNGWISTNTSLGNLNVISLFVSIQNEIYAGTALGVYKSIDTGKTWKNLDTARVAQFKINSIERSSTGNVFAATGSAGIWKYVENTKAWSRLTSGIDSTDTVFAALKFDKNGNLFALAKNRVYKSANEGAAWSKLNSFTTFPLHSISSDSAGTILLVGAFGGGTFKSTDAGNSWSSISSGLQSNYTYAALAFSLNELYVGVEGGLSRTTNSGASWLLVRSTPIRHILSDAINDRYAKDVNPYDSRQIYGWRPLPEYVDLSSKVMASNPAVDVNPKDGKPDSWPQSWYNFEKGEYVWPGYVRQDVPNADLEVLWGMDDKHNSEFRYFPVPTDTSIRGLGVKLESRALQWSNSLAQNCIFFIYTAQNYSDRDLDTVYFGMYGDVDVGGASSPENQDDLGFFISPFDSVTKTGIQVPVYSRSLVYLWDNDGKGYLNIPTHYNGCKFLESPGNSTDGIDNDADRVPNGKNPALLADESQTDGVDNDGDWNPKNDDVGVDGVPDTQDEGEGDGVPTAGKRLPDGTLDPLHPGEPHFELTDLDESDQIGLTAFKSWAWTEIAFKDDEVIWGILEKKFNDTIPNLTDINFLYGTGKIALKKRNTDGSIKRFSIALLMGTDLNDLLITARTVQVIYNQNYQFIRPPDKPIVNAVPGDKKITLYWDASAEESVDPILGKDFEGYVIYRSTDPQFSDINTVSDGFGSPFLYSPLTTSNGKVAKFDVALRPEPLFESDTSKTKNGRYDPGEYYIDVNKNGKYDAALVEDFYKGYSVVPYDQRGVAYYLGDNTGIVHSFVDSNNVINGQAYYYAVVSYDHGDIFTYPPTECTKRISVDPVTSELTFDVNTVKVIPGPRVSGYTLPRFASQNIIDQISGSATGKLKISIVDDLSIKDNVKYDIVFSDKLNLNGTISNKTNYYVVKQTPVITEVQLFDTNFVKLDHQYLFRDNILEVKNSKTGQVYSEGKDFVIDTARGFIRRKGNGSAMTNSGPYKVTYRYLAQPPSTLLTEEEANPVFDGLKLFVRNDIFGIDTAKSGWLIKKGTATGVYGKYSAGAQVFAPIDLQIIFNSVDTTADGKFVEPGDTLGSISSPAGKIVRTPFKIVNVTKDTAIQKIKVQAFVAEPNSTKNNKWEYGEQIVFLTPPPYRLASTNSMYVVTFSDTSFGKNISGAVYQMKMYLPFSSKDIYTFTTQSAKFNPNLASTQLNKIKVVPNPYVAVNDIEPTDRLPGTTRGSRRIYFEHLPKECTISIYTIAGELVKELYHYSGIDNGREYWDLLNRDNLGVAYGVYLAHIDAPNVGERIVKFAIIK